jgi:hypothetical protein
MINLTLLYVGTEHCINCRSFKPEWLKLTTMIAQDKINIKGVEITLEDIVVTSHDLLPLALQNTVPFYPFIMILPTEYYKENVNEDIVLVGEAMYTFRTMKDGVLRYVHGSSVNDSPNMRYPRTAEGIVEWIKECGIQSLQTLSVKYYPELSFEIMDDQNGLKMRSLPLNDLRMEMFIPPLNKEYLLDSRGMVLCRRIVSTHS